MLLMRRQNYRVRSKWRPVRMSHAIFSHEVRAIGRVTHGFHCREVLIGFDDFALIKGIPRRKLKVLDSVGTM